MKFYMSPGSCSTGIHILLEELDLVYEVYIVNLPNKVHLSREFSALNPKSTIPVLVNDDGETYTEFLAIAYWLANTYPNNGLWPEDINASTRTLELISFVVDTIHGKGFSRLFLTEEFSDGHLQYDSVRDKGRRIINDAFTHIDSQLNDRDYFNQSFSIADVALFYVEFWAQSTGIELPQNCKRHYQTMLTRPAVRNVMMEEGYHSYLV